MDCIFHGVAKSQTWLSNFHFHYSVEAGGRARPAVVPWWRTQSHGLHDFSVFPSRSHNCCCTAHHCHCDPLWKKRKSQLSLLEWGGKRSSWKSQGMWTVGLSCPPFFVEKCRRDIGENMVKQDNLQTLPKDEIRASECPVFFPTLSPVAPVSLTEVLTAHSEYKFQWPLCLPPLLWGARFTRLRF